MPDPILYSLADRVRRMEELFDDLQSAWKAEPFSLRENAVLTQMRMTLASYMDSGLWLADYELDEQGAFPPELKRSVLSLDGLYNFLQETKDPYKPDLL